MREVPGSAPAPGAPTRALRVRAETLEGPIEPRAKGARAARPKAAGDLRWDRTAVEELVYGEILSLVDVMGLPCGRPPAAVLVKRAAEIADAQPGPIPIAKLCSLLRVSPSSLENSFKKITGLSPHTFFLRRRLNLARAALLGADRGEGCVTDIALELGFSELGRFAVRYRQMFGESPPKTLRHQTRATAAICF